MKYFTLGCRTNVVLYFKAGDLVHFQIRNQCFYWCLISHKFFGKPHQHALAFCRSCNKIFRLWRINDWTLRRHCTIYIYMNIYQWTYLFYIHLCCNIMELKCSLYTKNIAYYCLIYKNTKNIVFLSVKKNNTGYEL